MTTKRKVSQTSKANTVTKKGSESKDSKDKKFKEIDLSQVGAGIDVKKALKDSENLQKVTLGPQYFPNERTMEGEFLQGIYLGNVPFKNEETGKGYEGVVIAPSEKEKVICISEKAVERLREVSPGTKVLITYLGDIRTNGGNMMRNITVSYFD